MPGTRSINTLAANLNRRRTELGISTTVLAERAGLSLRTVQRFLSGEEKNPSFETVAKLAASLGADLRLDAEPAESMRRRRAEDKADRLVAIVQGTAALEVQAVPEETLRALRDRTIHELLAGSPRRLWSD